MKYLVKVDAGAGKVETYTTEAPDAAAAMFAAYDKYGVCGVTVAPVEPDAYMVFNRDGEAFGYSPKSRPMKGLDWEPVYRVATPACPVDTAIANLDALLAERRASTMDHAQLAALGREQATAFDQFYAANFGDISAANPKGLETRDLYVARKTWSAAVAAADAARQAAS